MSAPHCAPELVFGYGNPSRGDDALGPMFVERLSNRGNRGQTTVLRCRETVVCPLFPADIELLTDFQLQPEHALDLRGRERVLFVDASSTCAEPYELLPLAPVPEASVFTHALAPGALLAVFERIEGAAPPPSWMLGIRGYAFELGEPLSARAAENLEAAIRWARDWLATSRP
jgi:hydrogenase maturation protease